MDEFIGLLLRGKAEVSAYEGFGGEFAVKLFRDVDECFATEDADSGEVGFIPPHTSSSVTTAPFLPPDRGTSTSASQLKENGIAQSLKTFYTYQSSMGTYCQFTNSPNVERDCFSSTQLAKSSGGQMMFLLRVNPMEAYTP